jgi:hypothetical protein
VSDRALLLVLVRIFASETEDSTSFSQQAASPYIVSNYKFIIISFIIKYTTGSATDSDKFTVSTYKKSKLKLSL